MGFYYVITKKGMKRSAADVGFMFIACNLRRLMNIIDKTEFTKFLQELVFQFAEIKSSIKAIIFKISHAIINLLNAQTFLNVSLNRF